MTGLRKWGATIAIIALVVLVLVVLGLAVTTDVQLRSRVVLLGLAALWLPMTLLISLCNTRRSA